jgi:16S rRNA A1518/A1519 N6-dimethyltransferase RsmA/KsgA/DIM1 with predicted DNA glycosylase/AP lyase activity
VDSSVVRLSRLDVPPVPDAAAFLQFAKACFRHKRKTLRNNLRSDYDPALVDRLPQGGLRAEQLSIQDLAAIHHTLAPACPL